MAEVGTDAVRWFFSSRAFTSGIDFDHPAEQALIRELLDFPDTVATAAERRETHEVPRYAYELASAFSAFYRDCKVLTDDAALTAARLALVDATRSVLANALELLGISAPQSM
jgi:arginyl-tRNA synthetase